MTEDRTPDTASLFRQQERDAARAEEYRLRQLADRGQLTEHDLQVQLALLRLRLSRS